MSNLYIAFRRSIFLIIFFVISVFIYLSISESGIIGVLFGIFVLIFSMLIIPLVFSIYATVLWKNKGGLSRVGIYILAILLYGGASYLEYQYLVNENCVCFSHLPVQFSEDPELDSAITSLLSRMAEDGRNDASTDPSYLLEFAYMSLLYFPLIILSNLVTFIQEGYIVDKILPILMKNYSLQDWHVLYGMMDFIYDDMPLDNFRTLLSDDKPLAHIDVIVLFWQFFKAACWGVYFALIFSSPPMSKMHESQKTAKGMT